MALEILISFAFQKTRLQVISCKALLLPLPQPYQHDGSRRFYLAVLIGRVFCNFVPIVDDLLCYDKAL
jgi:hypothetical protein